MYEQSPHEEQTSGIAEYEQALAGWPFPSALPIAPLPIPLVPPASGLYLWTRVLLPKRVPLRTPMPAPTPTRGSIQEPAPGHILEPQEQALRMEAETLYPWWFTKEELRLDVDGRYPQMVASGTTRSFFSSVHWIANLNATGLNTWTGNIWYKDGDIASFPYTDVEVQVTRSWFPDQRSAAVRFTGGGGTVRIRAFKFKSPYYHPVDFEFDCATGETATTTINTCAHPNRPATLACEILSVQTVFRRAGFDVTTSPGDTVPLAGAGANARWSDLEMHDAMQAYWSRFASSAQWAMWTFCASLHEMGTSLGGIMFDDIGANHRQGTAIFNDSFISNAPPGDPNPAAWVQRMLFWTVCHEMGHSFNLAHSWQKSAGVPWIPLANEPEARSFMNYPYRVSGGQTAFFSDFEYRFSDGELLFMRHAPARFVQMGNADWFDHHGFRDAEVSVEPALKLELRVNREGAVFEFLEPVTVELKLTNVSSQPQLLEENLLSSTDSMTLVLKKDGKPARQFFPYARYCWLAQKRALMTGESMYESLFISAGCSGWDMAEPGNYTIQVALRLDGEDVVSNALRVRVAPPRGYDEEFLAQDFFSEDVGRILAFNGSRFFTGGSDTLHEVAARLGDRRVSLHASMVLGNSLAQEYKKLVEDRKEPRKQLGIKTEPPQPGEARKLLAAALTTRPDTAIESFGHIIYRRHADHFADLLAQQGAPEEALKVQDAAYQTMQARQVNGRKILDRVLKEVGKKRDSYKRSRR